MNYLFWFITCSTMTITFGQIVKKSRVKNRFLDTYEDATLDPPQLLKKYGYPCEIYDVPTVDGYILQMHRIPPSKNDSITQNNPVIIEHGLGGSSIDFLLAGPQRGFAYLLANAGYDVWLSNARGNKYSRKHILLNPYKDKEYWNFSFHEIGIYDLPAIIDFVLNKTEAKKIFYVGYSQGTTVFYVMASERPEYNNYIKAQFSLAPVAYLSNIRSFFPVLISRSYYLPKAIIRLIGDANVNKASELANKLGALYCAGPISNIICSSFWFSIFGTNLKEYDKNLISIASGHIPAGSSSNQLIHFGQLVRSGRFCQYDFGLLGNLIRYKSYLPPSYNVTKITAPIYLFYSDGDLLSDPKDVIKLGKQLSNVKEYVKVNDPLWAHHDYAIGINAKTKVYDKILKFMADSW